MKLEFPQEFFKNPQISNLMKICPVEAKLFNAYRQNKTDRQTWQS